MHGVDGQLARDFAGRVAAHAVGDDGQHAAPALLGVVARLHDAAAVLVELADAADVADHVPGNLPRHGCSLAARRMLNVDVPVVVTWMSSRIGSKPSCFSSTDTVSPTRPT